MKAAALILTLLSVCLVPSAFASSPDLIVTRANWYVQQADIGLMSLGIPMDRAASDCVGSTLRQDPECVSVRQMLDLMVPCCGRADSSSRFVYAAEVSNTGKATIQRIDWDYVFVDSRTGMEAARHSFHTAMRIRAGGLATLRETSTKPPTNVVDVDQLMGWPHAPLQERVEIRSIRYADGTRWRE